MSGQGATRRKARRECQNAVLLYVKKTGSLIAEPVGGTPAEYREFLKSQVAYWAKVVEEAGLKIQP
jgi:hypothetical protein